MKAITVAEVQRYARICGFTLKREGSGYRLTTPYRATKYSTLREVDSAIRKDSARMNGSRF